MRVLAETVLHKVCPDLVHLLPPTGAKQVAQIVAAHRVGQAHAFHFSKIHILFSHLFATFSQSHTHSHMHPVHAKQARADTRLRRMLCAA